MKRPGRLALLGVALILLSRSQAACNSDTLWDLLRRGDPAQKRDTPIVPLERVSGAGSAPGQADSGPANTRSRGFPGFFASLGAALRRLGKQLGTEIKVSGEKKIGYHAERISGDRETYANDTYRGRPGIGGTYSDTDLLIQAKIGGVLHFEQHYTDRLTANPNDNRLFLHYATRRLTFDAGDIQAGITGNSLMGFNRALKGMEISAEVVRGLRLTTLFSQTKAQPRTITLQGANTAGPYYVYGGQVVDGSEKVRVNNRDMVRGTDYTFDSQTGRLDFLQGLIIHTTDTILVTFESYNYSSQAGTLTGWRADLGLLKGARMGLTYLTQSSAAGSGAVAARTEQFSGNTTPGSPYTLLYAVDVVVSTDSHGNKIATPRVAMKVTVDGVSKQYGTDYWVDPNLPNLVYLRLPYPGSTVVKITYTPAPDNQASGNRMVTGADATLALGRSGTVNLEMANSRLDSAGKSLTGAALQIHSDLRLLRDRLNLNVNLQDIGDHFTSIGTPGFRTNEKGLTVGMNYTPFKLLKFTLDFAQSKRPSYSSSSSSGKDDLSQMTFGADWQLSKTGRITLNHNTTTTLLSTGGETAYGTDNLAFDYGYRSLKMSLALGHNLSRSTYAPSQGSGNASYTHSLSDSLTSRLNLSWSAASRLTLNTTLSDSRIDNGNGTRTDARDIRIASDITALRNLRLNIGYQLQNSGSQSSTNTGAANPYTSGLGSAGDYSGSSSSSGAANSASSSYGGRSRTLTLALSYQPFQMLNLSFNANSSSSEGGYLADNRRNDMAVVASYTLGDRLSLSTNMSLQRVAYPGSAGGSDSSTLGLNLHARPFGKLAADLSYLKMRSNSRAATGSGSSPSAYDTNVTSSGVRLDYPVWRGSSLFCNLDASRTAGYGAADQHTLSCGLNIDLGGHMAFTLGWRDQQRVSHDTTTASSSTYHLNALDSDFSMHF